MVFVYEEKRADMDRRVERVDLPASVVILVRKVHKSVAVFVAQIIGQNGDISDTHFEVGIMATRTIGVEHYNCVRQICPARSARYVNAARGVLLAQYGTSGNPGEVEDVAVGAISCGSRAIGRDRGRQACAGLVNRVRLQRPEDQE